MKRFYLSGQTDFGNRGCEALVRSTLQLLKSQFGNDVEVLVPSFRPDLDAPQWPDAAKQGVRFVRALPFPSELKIWSRLLRLIPSVARRFFPSYRLPVDIENDLRGCDALLVIGGDNITLDYGLASLAWHVQFAAHAKRLGIPVMVWGASIGPFSKEPFAETHVAQFLRRIECVTVRETISLEYLKSIGVSSNVSLVADGAFVMAPESIDVSSFWPRNSKNGVLGFNISPLIQKFRPAGEAYSVLQKEVVGFLQEVLNKSELGILLLPHVDPLDGNRVNSDSYYMQEILNMLGAHDGRVTLVPATLNAAQLKGVLAQCRFFIGARTHATIGALSSQVPTVSIAYSIKAKGLNRDLFGDESLVLETPAVSKQTLFEYFEKLCTEEEQLRRFLASRIPDWKQRAHGSAGRLAEALQ
ncbi:polysaccharide pyruvyl transferase family protein [Roseateles sp. DAIF2]|uniref:polysaccharide pyruvyl transferase family protein n=1 Tax=Roseateles sp. DAIF2 TaxID=2714952 RepID=UPI0018A2C423|nr:polysaccharide pyruvyl transferase family protein [Roseateles sp. DAIF2]QPF75103.1 polysaccharide pyruvyl transferase family protein [Roseateles sp. DAIF2]